MNKSESAVINYPTAIKKRLCVFRLLRFIISNRFGKLVGARRVAFATDSRKQLFDFVNVLAFHKTRNPLQVATATTNKAYVVHFVVCINVE